MTNQLTQILEAGGLLLRMAGILVLRALFALSLGLIAVICAAQVLFLLTVDAGYRKSLFTSGSDRQKLLGGNGS
jgi:hypothetical protein